MQFFFPGTHEYIDPEYDLIKERHKSSRFPQSDYEYAHQSLSSPPYDGILLSRALIDPTMPKGRSIFRRWRKVSWGRGAREFLHLEDSYLRVMADCGAYSYVDYEKPPVSIRDTCDFYHRAQVDYGISPDHIVPGYMPNQCRSQNPPAGWVDRYDITLDLAHRFYRDCKSNGFSFHPIGVAQGWDPVSYASAVVSLQKMGYDYIAIGGLSRLLPSDVGTCLEGIRLVRWPGIRIHLLGVTPQFDWTWGQRWGIASFDTSMPFRQAFLNERDNFHTLKRNYLAIRVPRPDQNRSLRRKIDEGKVRYIDVRRLEKRCLDLLRKYDRGEAQIGPVLEAICSYERLYNGRDHTDAYTKLLSDRPWKTCGCVLCRESGIEIVLLRDKQRNNRRGFHNLHVFYQRLQSYTMT